MSARTAVVVALLAAGYYLLYRSPPVPQAQGGCRMQFKAVEEVFRQHYNQGVERGSALAVYHQGELVCDLWGGWADPTISLPWFKDTMPLVFSAVKAAGAISIALLCDRGFCSYGRLVSHYWPEFAQNGKDKVTLGMLLSHQAGLAAVNKTLTLHMLDTDPQGVGQILAEQAPNWTPGSGHGYHTLTMGALMEQLVRRIDPQHRSLWDFYREEIAEPYDVDFYIGLPWSKQWRATRFIEQPLCGSLYDMVLDPHMYTLVNHLLFQTRVDSLRVFYNPEIKNLNWPNVRAIGDGSFNGYGTARGLARLVSLVMAGDHHALLEDRRPLLSPRAVSRLTTPLSSGPDWVLGVNMTYGPGIGIFKQLGEKGYTGVGSAGKGGNLVLGIDRLNLSVAYVTSYLSSYFSPLSDPRVRPLIDALLRAV